MCERAGAQADKVRGMLNQMFEDEGVAWAAYGMFGAFYLFTNPENTPIKPTAFDPLTIDPLVLKKSSPFMNKLSLALLVNGVDVGGKPAGKMSSVHTDEDLKHTVEAMRKAIHMLRDDGDL